TGSIFYSALRTTHGDYATAFRHGVISITGFIAAALLLAVADAVSGGAAASRARPETARRSEPAPFRPRPPHGDAPRDPGPQTLSGTSCLRPSALRANRRPGPQRRQAPGRVASDRARDS